MGYRIGGIAFRASDGCIATTYLNLIFRKCESVNVDNRAPHLSSNLRRGFSLSHIFNCD
jgi:hypothetical protein